MLDLQSFPPTAGAPWYDLLMRRRLLTIVTASMILMMVLPPVFSVVDKWDKGPELPLVGHDTEITLMMAAVDVGLGVAVAWSSVCLLAWLAAVLLLGMIETAVPVHAHRGVRVTEYLLMLFSPPWRIVSLRI
jgi:hypothetical protein